MRNTRKILLAFLVVFTLLMSLVVVASAAATTGPTTIYLTPGSEWNKDNARFALYTWDGGDKWFDMTDEDGDGTFECVISAGITNIIFCRMNGDAAANNWDNKWNQTVDLKYDGTNNHCTISNHWASKASGTWSLIEVACNHSYNEGTVTKEPTCTEDGKLTKVCSECNESYDEALPARHTYGADNKCQLCEFEGVFIIAGNVADNETGNNETLFGTNWDVTNDANRVNYDPELGCFVKVYYNVAAGGYSFKVAQNRSWGVSYGYQGGSSNSYVKVTEGQEVIITFDPITKYVVGEARDHEHNYVDGVCSGCKAEDPDYVACEHEYEENVFYHPELVAATCCAPGVAVFECTKCDHYYTEATPVDPAAHDFLGGESEVITPADCKTETNGVKKVTCANGCGTTEEQTIYYESSHDMKVEKDVLATCTTPGEYYSACTICGLVEEYYSEAQGHYNWYLTCGQTGTCMADGCGVEFTLEHEGDAATCTNPMYCYNCWSYVGEPLGHTFVDGKCECGESDPNYTPVEPDYPEVILGDNAVTVSPDGPLNAGGTVIAWLEFVPAETGTYKVSSADLKTFFYSKPDTNDWYACICGFKGTANLEAGVTYYVCAGDNGKTGDFTVTIEKLGGDVELPAVNTVVLGENNYVLNDALLAIEYEFIGIEITEPGTYVIKGGAPMTVFFFTVPGTLDTSSPYGWNIDNVTYEYLDEFYVTLAEAGTYWVGFRYDNVGDLREFDYNISLHTEHNFVDGKCVCGAEDPNYVPPHEHNFVDGKCECGESDPNYVPPHVHNFVEGKCECGESDPNYVPPVVDTPADPQPEEPVVELNWFQKIWLAILDFFKKLFGLA